LPRKTRNLSDADRDIWLRVTDNVTPLKKQQAAKPSVGPKIKFPKRVVQASQPLLPRLTPKPPSSPQTRISLAPDPMHAAAATPPAMDTKAYGRMKRGKLVPEARIDLHGMTAERANGALRGFVLDASARGLRLVLVITGKGRAVDDYDSPARRGILRNAVPVWLSQPPLAPLVLQLAPAHQRHGGGGAYYVYLKRHR